MQYINWYTVIFASVSSMILRYAWYSSLLFGKLWKRENNFQEDQSNVQSVIKKYAISFCMMFVYCTLLAKIKLWIEFNGFADGIKLGMLTGICFAAMSIGIVYQFSNKTTMLYYIDAGYIITASCLMGGVLAV